MRCFVELDGTRYDGTYDDDDTKDDTAGTAVAAAVPTIRPTTGLLLRFVAICTVLPVLTLLVVRDDDDAVFLENPVWVCIM